jgi:choline dehydrogenase
MSGTDAEGAKEALIRRPGRGRRRDDEQQQQEDEPREHGGNGGGGGMPRLTTILLLVGTALLIVAVVLAGISLANINHGNDVAAHNLQILMTHSNLTKKRDLSQPPSVLDDIYSGVTVLGATVAGSTKKRRTCGKKITDDDKPCYDVIIVGAGGAGATMANVLSANGTLQVLLVEAGDDNYADQPIQNSDYALATTFYYFVPQYFWAGESVPQYQIQPSTPSFRYTNGRLLGGGTAINTQLHMRGTDAYWNRMDSLTGGTGIWSAAAMRNVMQRQENFTTHGHFVANSANRGTTGKYSVHTRPVRPSTDGDYLMSTASSAYGIPQQNDMNDPATPIGFYKKQQITQRHETPSYLRETTAQAFLDSTVMNQQTYKGVNGRQLTVKLRSTVNRILFHENDPTRAIGVSYIDYSGPIPEVVTAFATQSVVLAAGIRDAQLLQLSGIGPAATLAAAGVAPRVVNEHVGRHWKNHIGVIMFCIAPNITGANTDASGGPYLPGNNLPLGVGYLPDPSPAGSPTKRSFQHIFVPTTYTNGPNAVGAVLNIMFHLTPLSEGTIDIQNADPEKTPLTNPGYLTNPADLTSMTAAAMEFSARMTAQDPNFFVANGVNMTDAGQVSYWIKNNLHFGHHWSASTRMSPDATTGAVNVRTRVHGTKGLRVCSTSIMPDVPDANTGVPVVAMADICARLLIDDINNGGD